jgi:hypothetical protein
MLSIAVQTGKECAYRLYADDLKLYTAPNVDCDEVELQERLNDLHAGSNIWQLKISFKECLSMLINAVSHEPNIELELGDNVIPATAVSIVSTFHKTHRRAKSPNAVCPHYFITCADPHHIYTTDDWIMDTYKAFDASQY